MDTTTAYVLARRVALAELQHWFNEIADLDPYSVAEEDEAQVFIALHSLQQQLETEIDVATGIREVFHGGR